MEWCETFVPIKQLGEIVSGSTPDTAVMEYWDGHIPWITPADLTEHDGVFYRGSPRRITEAGFKSCSAKLLPAGSILFSSRAPIGHCAVTTYPICTNQGFKSLVPNERLHSTYGFFALKYFTPQIIWKGRGATFSEVTKEIMEDVSIPLPPLSKQKRLAAILKRADRLRRLRRYALELSHAYLQSVFLEMFGDPVKNPMRWERAKVSDLGKVQTGNTPSRDNPLNYGNYIEWLKSDNIIGGNMFVSKSREMLSKQGAKIGRIVEAGSVLVTCIAGSPTSIGNVALTDRLVAFNQQINSVTHHKDVDPLFLYGMLKVAKPLVQRSTTLGMKQIITKSNFENLVLIKPPQPQQQRFAGIIQKFERLRSQQREAERQAEHLFQTLLHRAFTGALN